VGEPGRSAGSTGHSESGCRANDCLWRRAGPWPHDHDASCPGRFVTEL